MFELTFNTLFMFYLAITTAMVLGIWIYSHYRMRRRTFFSTEQALFVCEYCHFAYVENSLKDFNRCPQCELFNKNNAYSPNQKSTEMENK